MPSTSINVGKFGINSVSSGNVLLTTRPDLRILKVGVLAAALIAVGGAVVYLLPIDGSLKVAFLPLAVLFVVILAYSVVMYEALGNRLLEILDSRWLVALTGRDRVSFFLEAITFTNRAANEMRDTVFVVTNDHIEEKGGLIWKTQHRIPLTYVRDVTYDQNFLQSMFGVSSVTVTPTNENKIVFRNISEGERTRETIWNLVLSKSPRSASAL